MKRLKLEDLSNAPDLPTKEVEIPEWNKSVIVQGLSKKDSVHINKLANVDGDQRDDILFEKLLIQYGVIDPDLEDLDQVEKFYEVSTPMIIDRILIAIYKCMAWTKEDQREIADQFPK